MPQITTSGNADVGFYAYRYQHHQAEKTLLYQLVSNYYPAFTEYLAREGKVLPDYVQREFEAYLKCGKLERGFLRVRCGNCQEERLVAFGCKRRGFFPSCGVRRMAESAALLVDEVFPHQPMRQWVLSFPFQLRFLFASRPLITGQVLGIVYRVIATHLIKKAGYPYKRPYRDGTTHVIFEPLDFMARLAALVPRPGVNLTRFHGVFAPNSKHRALITPTKLGKGNNREENCKTGDCESANHHTAMTWTQRLKRVFNIEITTCDTCGGTVKVIASIEEPAVIKQILAHLEKKLNQKNAGHHRKRGSADSRLR